MNPNAESQPEEQGPQPTPSGEPVPGMPQGSTGDAAHPQPAPADTAPLTQQVAETAPLWHTPSRPPAAETPAPVPPSAPVTPAPSPSPYAGTPYAQPTGPQNPAPGGYPPPVYPPSASYPQHPYPMAPSPQPYPGQPQPYPGQGYAGGYSRLDQPSTPPPSYLGAGPAETSPQAPPPPGGAGYPGAPTFGGTPGDETLTDTPTWNPPAGPTGEKDPASRRRPGWAAVIGIGVAASLVSSALTGTIVTLTHHDSSASVATTSTDSSLGQGGGGSKVPVSVSTGGPDWKAVASAVERSVVSVQLQNDEGSGVILDAAGHVVTNNHVVADGGDIRVVLWDGRGYSATVVGTDPQTDLAVIKIKNPPSDLVPTTFGDSSQVQVGNPVMAVGNALGLADTVTTGIVSAIDRPVTTSVEQQQQQQNTDPFGLGNQGSVSSDTQVFTSAIQTDAAVNPGNSGGALVNAQGELIGINSSIASLSSSSLFGGSSQAGSIGLGFAIPVNEVRSVAEQLIASGKVTHAWLGVSLRTGSVTLDGATRDGAEIGKVSAGSPAAKGGLKVGDVVIAIDNHAVNGSNALIAQIRARRPDSQTVLTVIRSGKTISLTVTFGTQPDQQN